MGRSRYAGNQIVDGKYYETWDDPSSRDQFAPDILDGVETVEHVVQSGERLDIIAHRYYGDEDYWWVVAIANRIMDPFLITIGRRLRIPTAAKSILDKMKR